MPLPPAADNFDFVCLGDNRPAGAGLPPTNTFVEMLQEVDLIHPAFVLSSGDLVYGNEEPIDMYRHELDTVQGLISRLHEPFFNAPGNHEINHRQDFQDEYTRRFGPLWGSFDYGSWRFIALSTDQADASASISASEMQFLSTALSDSKPACVFMHRPVFGRKDNSEVGAVVAQGPALHDLFKSHNVKMVCEGHDHVFNHQTHDGIEYYISGGAGAPLDAPPQDGGFFHFLIVHVRGDQLTVDVIPLGALALTHAGVEWDVANYSDYDVQARDVVVDLPRKPSGVTALLDKKGKMKTVPSSLVEATGGGDHWQAHVSVLLAAHGKTVLQFG